VPDMAEGEGKQATGEKKARKPWTLKEFGGKTFWDWMQLLIVPIVLLLITVAFTWQQDARQQRIEDQRAEAERKLAEQRAQDEALQAYLDQMSTLLLEKDLRDSEPDSEVRTLARARTLTVLERLDPSRKTQVMRFLLEADLVQSADETVPIIALAGADLREARLRAANLRAADLREADLDSAILSGASLREADLNWADLSNAYLSPDVDLREADLSHAYLLFADLSGADLSGANLSGAHLREADLRETNMQGARGVTNDELEQQVASLEGATMPNGQKYEEWLKSKGREEDGRNSGPS
jgi:uncharacterized protein YjbI with pentapeptide repeats